MTDATAEQQIRPPTEEELKKLRPHFPGLVARRGTTEPLVAVAEPDEKGDEQIVGVAVLQLLPGGGFVEQVVFNMTVGEPHRRRGIGTRLLDRVVCAAREAGAGTLITGVAITEGSGPGKFLARKGMVLHHPMTTYETSPSAILSYVEPVYERLRARGKVPENGRIVSLGEAPSDQVREVVMRNMGTSSPVIAERVRAGVKSYSQQISKVALVDGKVVGANLITWKNALAVVDAHAVEPAWRHTWVSVGLKCELLRNLIERDTTRLRFTANPEANSDTAKMARRTDAKILSTAGRYRMDL